jgi:hypothetical protein
LLIFRAYSFLLIFIFIYIFLFYLLLFCLVTSLFIRILYCC